MERDKKKCFGCKCSTCKKNGFERSNRWGDKSQICLGCSYCFINNATAVKDTCRTYEQKFFGGAYKWLM